MSLARPQKKAVRAPSPLLIAAAEREIAENGYAGASMRRIARRAGLKNVAAVQYHFGDLAGAVEAVFAFRAAPIDAARARIIAAIAPAAPGIRPWVAAIVSPVADFMRSEPGGTFYLRFMEAAVRGLGAQAIEASALIAPHYAIAVAALWARAPQLREDDRLRRLRLAARFYISALADLEQALSAAAPAEADRLRRIDEAETDILGAAESMILAP